MDEPPIRLFVMGENRWRWLNTNGLSPEPESVNYYLHSQGQANSTNGDGTLSPQPPGDEPPDVFLYNPADPVPTRGGPLCCNAYFMAGGAYDQQEIERRQDVLVYSTPPLERDVEVTGPITVTLWAATSSRRYRLHGQAGRRVRARLRPQPHRRHHPRPLPRRQIHPKPGGAGPGVWLHDRPVGHQALHQKCLLHQ